MGDGREIELEWRGGGGRVAQGYFLVKDYWECAATLFPGSFVSREKDPRWVWSRATQILGGNK